MRNAAVGENPLLEHPLAPTPRTDVEPTLRTAYRPTSQSSPAVAASRSPSQLTSPRSVLRPDDDDDGSSPNAPPPNRRLPRVIRTSPGVDDPLSRALRATTAPPIRARAPAATVAYATAPESLFERQISADGASTARGVALLTPKHSDSTAATSPRGGEITDVRVLTDTVAGVFIVKSWRDDDDASDDSDDNTSSSSSDSEATRVCRSIADFVWLENRLRARYDGVIVPHLPPMALRGRLLHGFAYETERLRGLQRFLALLITHPTLKHVEETAAFLGASGTAWQHARARPLKKPHRALAIAADGDNPLRAWTAFRLWQAGRRVNRAVGWFLNRDVVEPQHQLSPEEKALERLQHYVASLENALQHTRTANNDAADADIACAQRYALLQRALATLAEQEGGAFADVLASPPSLPTMADDDVARRRLDDVLCEYARRAQAAQQLVALRCNEREAYEYAVENYATLRARWEASSSSVWDNTAAPATNAHVVDNSELHTQLAAAADILATAQRAYQLVDRSTHDELRRLRAQMHDDVLAALRDVAEQRAEAHTGMRDAWSRIVVRIDEQLLPDA